MARVNISFTTDNPQDFTFTVDGEPVRDVKLLRLMAGAGQFTTAVLTQYLRDENNNLIGEVIDNEQYVAEATFDLFDYLAEKPEPQSYYNEPEGDEPPCQEPNKPI